MKYLLYSLLIVLVSSCISHKKSLYVHDTLQNAISIEDLPLDSTIEYKIQPGDILNVEISSTLPNNAEILNKELESTGGGPSNAGVKGYLVDKEGNIEMPIIGVLHVEGMVVRDINTEIKNKISQYLDYVFVKTSLVNFKVTVLGEVGNPGTFTITDEKTTIFQVLGMASDINEMGNKKRIKIFRKNKNQTQIITVDITKTDLLTSKYYFIFPNDVIYVEPLKAKVVKFNLANATYLVSVISLTLLIANFIRNNR